MEKPKVVLLIFASGKIVLTGAKKREEIYEAYDKILPLLSTHRNKAVWKLLINNDLHEPGGFESCMWYANRNQNSHIEFDKFCVKIMTKRNIHNSKFQFDK